MTKENYKGSKAKVDALVKKLIKDNMYDPNEEEQWLIDEYDKFNHHANQFNHNVILSTSLIFKYFAMFLLYQFDPGIKFPKSEPQLFPYKSLLKYY